MKKRITWGAAVLLLLLTICAMRSAEELQLHCQSISLRYRQPVAAAADAKSQPTFWTETTLTLQGKYHTTKSRVLLYSGDPTLVYGAPCQQGGQPGPLDQTGCSISSVLAHQLYGSQNAVGVELRTQKKRYVVRGVFEDTQALALLPDGDASFTAVELAMDDAAHQNPQDWVMQQLLTCGLPTPDWILYLPEFAAVVSAFGWLPTVFGGVLLVAWLLRVYRNWTISVRDIAVFFLLLVVALLLPAFFSLWPQWLIPPRWSDFSWWGILGQQLEQRRIDWLSMPPAGRDVILKTTWFQQLARTAGQCVLCEVLRCRLWRQRWQPETKQ